MRYFTMLCFSFSLIFANGCVRKSAVPSDLAAMVAAEYAFSNLSVQKGIREAFLIYLSDDAILFRPQPVTGKQLHQQRPASPAGLVWWPIFADISRAGDMGCSTGPWEFKRDSTEVEPVAFGHFVSVWKKQADGLWRVALDGGSSHSRPETKVAGLDTVALMQVKSDPTASVDTSAARADLLEADRAFSTASAESGFSEAFLKRAWGDVRLYREGEFPVVGEEAVRAALAGVSGELTWAPTAGGVARSGDFGYTYGFAQHRASDGNGGISESTYMRIWKKNPVNEWNILIEVFFPMPPDTAQSN